MQRFSESRTVRGIAAAALLAGCGGISNEDLAFAAALPDESLAVSTPAPAAALRTDVEEVEPIESAHAGAESLNRIFRAVTGNLRTVLATAPSERRAGRRVWGPMRLVLRGVFVRVTATRIETAACEGDVPATDDGARRLAFTLEMAPARSGPWTEVARGTVKGEAFDASCGQLSVDVTPGAALGWTPVAEDPPTLTVTWSHDATGRKLALALDGPGEREGLIGALAAEQRADGRGRFAFTRRLNVNRPIVTPRLAERVEFTVQWLALGGQGRADFVISEGNFDTPVHLTRCWQAPGNPTFAGDDAGLGASFGDPASCAPLVAP